MEGDLFNKKVTMKSEKLWRDYNILISHVTMIGL